MEPNKPNNTPGEASQNRPARNNPVAGNQPPEQRRPDAPQGAQQPAQPQGGQPRQQGQGGQQPRYPRRSQGDRGQNRPAAQAAGAQGANAARGGQGRPQGQGQPQGEPRAVSGAVSKARRRVQQQMPAHTDLLPSLDKMPVNKSMYNGLSGAQQSKKGQNRGPANQAGPRVDKLRVMILGGLGEIGKNMMALEYGNDIVILDMGFAFPDENLPGVDYIIPDTTYLEKNKHKVRGIIITHGHMDHIGAAGYIIPKFPVPVYGSRLSLAFVEKQISEFKIHTPKWVVLDPDKHERVQLGVFNIELVRVTHTISDATAIVVRTPVGTVIDTGDWRPDPTPLDGKHMDLARLGELGQEGVLLLMSDATSCDRPGHTVSEMVVEPTLEELFARAKNRIIISTFSSSISRVQMIINTAVKSGRKLALVGRSTLANVEVCVRLGYIKIPQGTLVRVQDLANVPDSQVVVLCTGSQGEENSALVRMSTGDHQNIKIKAGDTIMLSSSVIPGNETSVVRLIDNLMREGATVFARSTEGLKDHGPIHVGGHAFNADTGDLVKLVKPKYFMPIHGEFHHLVYCAEAATSNGVPSENVFVMDNGDVLELTENSAAKGQRIPAGMVLIDGDGVGDVEGVVLRDRLAMGQEGVFTIVATVSRKTGKLISSPDIISRGFIYMKENEELINKARAEVRKAFERRNVNEPTDWAKFKLRLRDDIGDLLYSKTKRNPMILPVINEV